MVVCLSTVPITINETFQCKAKHLTLLNKQLFIIVIVLMVFLTGGNLPSFAQQQKIDSIKTIVANCKLDTNYVNSLNELCLIYKNAYTYEIADSIAKVALAKAQLIKYPYGILRSNLNLAEIQYELLNYSKSLEIYQTLTDLSSQYNNKKYLAICYHRIAMIFEDQGKLEESLKYNLKALEIRKELNDKLGISYSLSRIASYYMHKSDFNKTLDYYFEVIKIYIELNDKKSIAYTYYNIGKVYFNIYNYSEAIQFYNQCKEMTLELNDIRAYATTIRSIGEIYYRLGNEGEAIKNFKEALENAIKTKDDITIAASYVGIGSVLQKQKKFQEALQLYQKALISFEKIDYKTGIMVASFNIGETNIRLRKLTTAKEFINKGLILNKESGGFKEFFKGAYYNLFEIDSIQNNWESAFNNYRLYSLYRDSLFKEANSKTKDSLRLDYEYGNNAAIEKANHEKETALLIQKEKNKRNIVISIIGCAILIFFISFLNFRNKKKKEQAILKQKTAELYRQISEANMKALRSQMNPHFIFNCVDTVERLLNDAKIEESKICLEQFSSLTRSVLENSIKREIPLDDELKTLQLYMQLENLRFRIPFTYSITVEPGIDTKTTLIPPLVLQPFIENSIKHGFREPEKSGHLKILVQRENELLVCIIEDNGIGRNECMKIASKSGFKKESVGIKLTEERLSLISEMNKTKSYFRIDDLVDEQNNPKGTRIKMLLPYELTV
jgi:tetratricopeptide (TPR) repeat protein